MVSLEVPSFHGRNIEPGNCSEDISNDQESTSYAYQPTKRDKNSASYAYQASTAKGKEKISIIFESLKTDSTGYVV